MLLYWVKPCGFCMNQILSMMIVLRCCTHIGVMKEKETKTISYEDLYGLDAQWYRGVNLENQFLYHLAHSLQVAGIKTLEDLLRINEAALIDNHIIKKDHLSEINKYLEKVFLSTDERTFIELYGVDPYSYKNEDIDNGLSVRSYNCLVRHQINTVADLLQLSRSDLKKIKNLGRGSLIEICNYIKRVIEIKSHETIEERIAKKKIDLHPLDTYLKAHDYSFLDSKEENIKFEGIPEEVVQCYRCTEALLGHDFINCIMDNTQYAKELYLMLLEFVKEQKRRKFLLNEIEKIPKKRREKLAEPYYRAYNEWGILQNEVNEPGKMLEEVIINSVKDEKLYREGVSFAKWCQFDLQRTIAAFFNEITKENYRFILSERSEGKTLAEVGDILSITRERVRQIEAKIRRKFEGRIRATKFFEFLSADNDGTSIITQEMLRVACGEYYKEAVYLLKISESCNAVYYRPLDVFILGDKAALFSFSSEFNQLPSIVKKNDMVHLVENHFGDIVNERVLLGLLNEKYLQGEIYYTKHPTVAEKVAYVLKEYYPDGVHAYGKKEIAEFGQKYKDLFGEEMASDHSFAATLQRVGILCDRGTYRVKKEKYISFELTDWLLAYIESVDQPVLVVEDIFEEFKSRLLQEGVTNKYYLCGILQILLADKYRVHRNFVFKDSKIGSVYEAIVRFIQDSDAPVSNEEIKNALVGVKDLYIGWAVAGDEKILNMYGKYYNADKLDFSENEIEYFHSAIDSIVCDGAVHHGKELYQVISKEKPYALTRNYIQYPFALFSVLEYYFGTEYKFLRPNVARIGVPIDNNEAMFMSSLHEYDELSIEDIKNIADSYHFTVFSYIELAEKLNDKFLMIDSNNFLDISKTGVSESTAERIEELITNEATQTMPVKDLLCKFQYPKINVPWTDWLVYSILKKWGTKTAVGTVGTRLKMAIPVVAPKGKLDTSSVDIGEASSDRIEETFFNLDDLLAEEAAKELNFEL